MKTLTALNRSLKAIPLEDRDVALVALGKLYAAQLDAHPEQSWRIGPKLLDVLIELKMTPRARSAVIGGDSSNDDASGPVRFSLDELRERRERRAANLDASAP